MLFDSRNIVVDRNSIILIVAFDWTSYSNSVESVATVK